MKQTKDRKIIERNDGFYLAYAKWADYPILKEINSTGFSTTPKIYYNQWLFRKDPTWKMRIGQVLARLCTIRFFARMVKVLFPYGYAVIIKCVSPEGKIIGTGTIYNLKKFNKKGEFVATPARWIIEKYHGKGLGGNFLMELLEKIAKEENIVRLRGLITMENAPSLVTLERRGWKIKDVGKDLQNQVTEYEYEIKEIYKDL